MAHLALDVPEPITGDNCHFGMILGGRSAAEDRPNVAILPGAGLRDLDGQMRQELGT